MLVTVQWLEEKEEENSVVVPIAPSRVCLLWSNLFLNFTRLHQLLTACRLETMSFNTLTNTLQGQVLVKWVKLLRIPINENTRVRLSLCKWTPCVMTSRPPVDRPVQRNMFYKKHLLLGLNLMSDPLWAPLLHRTSEEFSQVFPWGSSCFFSEGFR